MPSHLARTIVLVSLLAYGVQTGRAQSQPTETSRDADYWAGIIRAIIPSHEYSEETRQYARQRALAHGLEFQKAVFARSADLTDAEWGVISSILTEQFHGGFLEELLPAAHSDSEKVALRALYQLKMYLQKRGRAIDDCAYLATTAGNIFTKSKSGAVRTSAIELAELCLHPNAVPALLTGLTDPSAMIRLMCCLAVTKIDRAPPSALDIISPLVADDNVDEYVRQMACKALGDLGPKAAGTWDSLMKALEDESVRALAADSLLRIDRKRAAGLVSKAIDNEEMPPPMQALLLALCGSGTKDDVELLAKAMDAVEGPARSEAARALGRIRTPAAAQVLRKHLADGDKNIRCIAAAAMALDPGAAGVLRRMLQEEKDENVRASVILSLGELKDPGLARELLDRCFIGNIYRQAERDATVKVLSAIDTPEVRERMYEALGRGGHAFFIVQAYWRAGLSSGRARAFLDLYVKKPIPQGVGLLTYMLTEGGTRLLLTRKEQEAAEADFAKAVDDPARLDALNPGFRNQPLVARTFTFHERGFVSVDFVGLRPRDDRSDVERSASWIRAHLAGSAPDLKTSRDLLDLLRPRPGPIIRCTVIYHKTGDKYKPIATTDVIRMPSAFQSPLDPLRPYH